MPFIFTKINLSFIDALFESMSGVTTTGSTVLINLESYPKGILLWRSFLQWIGGIGIVIIALFILPFLRVGGMQLFHLEGDDPYDKFLPKISSVITKISIIYLSLTFILILFYYVFGMSIFDAITHSFTTISTGGFSNHDQSFALFNNNSFIRFNLILNYEYNNDHNRSIIVLFQKFNFIIKNNINIINHRLS